MSSSALRMIIFGDSISAYRGDLKVASIQLTERLEDRYSHFEFINAGVRGNTTEMGRARFQQDVLDLSPDVVIIAFGTNDSAIDIYLGKTEPRVSLERYSENLRYFITELHKQNVKVIFYSNPPVYITDDTKRKYEFKLDQYMDAERGIVSALSCYYVDIRQKFLEKVGGYSEKLLDYMPDGMHPNEEGHKIIADGIWDLMEKNPEIMNFS